MAAIAREQNQEIGLPVIKSLKKREKMLFTYRFSLASTRLCLCLLVQPNTEHVFGIFFGFFSKKSFLKGRYTKMYAK